MSGGAEHPPTGSGTQAEPAVARPRDGHVVQLRLSWPLRYLTLTSGLAVLATLVVARSLNPSERGYGTHRQLGLPPCTSVALWGVTCPSCGMTTSWALATRGRWVEAAQANAGGLLLAIIAMAYLPASCYFFTTGRTSRGGRFSLGLAISLLSALIVAIVQWSIRLAL